LRVGFVPWFSWGLRITFVKTGSSRFSVFLLSLKHLVKLFLAPIQKQLSKVHLRVLLIIKLLKQSYA
jgi:hypothetical protein